MSPAVNCFVHPVKVMSVCFCEFDSSGLLLPQIELPAGKSLKVDFLISSSKVPMLSASNVND